jgi:hypothetical protein
VQSAMNDFSDYYDEGNFEIDIIDGNGTDSWPLAWMTHFAIAKNASSRDCTNVQELLTFIAWVHTNDAYLLLPALALHRFPNHFFLFLFFVGPPRLPRLSTWPLCR